MSKNDLLNIIRGICIGQFIIVLLFVLRHGVTHSEVLLVAASGGFGLLFDGFSHTAIKFHAAQKAKEDLDTEFGELVKEIEEKKNEAPRCKQRGIKMGPL